MNRKAMFLGAILLAAGGCRMGGDTGVVDPALEARLLSFEVRDGSTTREELLLQLGAPTSEFEKGRLIVHRLFIGTTGRLLPVSAATNEPVALNRRLYDLVLVVENGVLSRHSLVRVR